MPQKGNKFLIRESGELPKVFIALAAMEKILCFTRLTEYEINGLGTVERRGNDFLITEAFILDQEAGVATAEIDPMTLNQFVGECREPEKLKFQWHSHGRIPAFFSTEDTSTIARYFNDFMISLVVSKNGEYQCRLDLFRPFRAVFRVNIEILLPFGKDLIEYCRKEIKQKIKPKIFDAMAGLFTNRDFRLAEWPPDNPSAIPLDDISCEDPNSALVILLDEPDYEVDR